jgi:hypothetical protein
VLLSQQIGELARKLRAEAAGRPYVATLIPQVVDDETFWTMVVELLEIVLHRDDFVVVRRGVQEIE